MKNHFIKVFILSLVIMFTFNVCALEEPQEVKVPGTTWSAYKVSHSLEDIYIVKDFTLTDELKIKEAIVVFGKVSKGFMEAIFIPLEEQDFKYSDFGNGKIEYIYYRFEPATYLSMFKSKLHQEVIKNKESIFQQALQIYKTNFQDFLHHGEYAILSTGKNITSIKLTGQNLYFVLLDNTWCAAERNEHNGVLEPYYHKYNEDIFIVYYPPSSIIKDSQPSWLSPRKKAFEYICNYLGVDWKYGNISFYVFNNREQGKAYGYPELGFANPSKNQIYTLPSQSIGHELTHVISFRVNHGKRVNSIMINEGLATLLNLSGDNPDHTSKFLFKKEQLEPSNLINTGFRKCRYGYTYGASFVKYLIKTYGLDQFLKFFGQDEYTEEASFQIFYHKDFLILFNEWKEYIKITQFDKKENEFYFK